MSELEKNKASFFSNNDRTGYNTPNPQLVGTVKRRVYQIIAPARCCSP